jgi:hypothetical protein
MTHVIRRRQPRHDGTRYFNDRGPCARDPNGGAEYDSAEEADAARRGLREPHLWDVLPMHEAAALDIEARAEAKREAWRHLAVPGTRRARMLFATIGGLVPGIKT